MKAPVAAFDYVTGRGAGCRRPVYCVHRLDVTIDVRDAPVAPGRQIEQVIEKLGVDKRHVGGDDGDVWCRNRPESSCNAGHWPFVRDRIRCESDVDINRCGS